MEIKGKSYRSCSSLVTTVGGNIVFGIVNIGCEPGQLKSTPLYP